VGGELLAAAALIALWYHGRGYKMALVNEWYIPKVVLECLRLDAAIASFGQPPRQGVVPVAALARTGCAGMGPGTD